MKSNMPHVHLSLPRVLPIQKKKNTKNTAQKAKSIWGIFANQTTLNHVELRNDVKKWCEKYNSNRNEQLSLLLQHEHIEFRSDPIQLNNATDEHYNEYYITDTEWEQISAENWDNVWNRMNFVDNHL